MGDILLWWHTETLLSCQCRPITVYKDCMHISKSQIENGNSLQVSHFSKDDWLCFNSMHNYLLYSVLYNVFTYLLNVFIYLLDPPTRWWSGWCNAQKRASGVSNDISQTHDYLCKMLQSWKGADLKLYTIDVPKACNRPVVLIFSFVRTYSLLDQSLCRQGCHR